MSILAGDGEPLLFSKAGFFPWSVLSIGKVKFNPSPVFQVHFPKDV